MSGGRKNSRKSKIHSRGSEIRASVETPRKELRPVRSLPAAASLFGSTSADLPAGFLCSLFEKDVTKPGENKMISDPFKVHKLNHRGMARAERIARMFENHLAIVREICGVHSGDLAFGDFEKCVEHMQLASFYAKRSLAVRHENQEQANEMQGQAGAGDAPSVYPLTVAGMPIEKLTSSDLRTFRLEIDRILKSRD
jgi:hypothetical protein